MPAKIPQVLYDVGILDETHLRNSHYVGLSTSNANLSGRSLSNQRYIDSLKARTASIILVAIPVPAPEVSFSEAQDLPKTRPLEPCRRLAAR
jgi:hypothetical protein